MTRGHLVGARVEGARLRRALKSAMDRLGAGVLILLLAPVLLVVSVAVLVRDGRPLVFRHTRVGQHGEEFQLLKFRTMRRGADAMMSVLVRDAGHASTPPYFKLRQDPRVTRLGAFLRKTSLDELPQLFNVLRGEMSLVGPRPHTRVEVEAYDERVRARLAVKPGMTGLWQVSGRSDVDPSEALELDLAYVADWSLRNDLTILLRTFRAVASGRGAY